jgi:hypothetical protein
MRIQGTGEKNDPIYLDEEYETDNLKEEFTKSDLDMGAHQGDRDLDFSYGTAFEKLEYESYIDKPNPWHADLRKPLFPAQVIGFRWMFERHGKGGGVVADKVGIGKVSISASVPAALLSWQKLIARHIRRSITSLCSRRISPNVRIRRRTIGICVFWLSTTPLSSWHGPKQ